MSESHWSKQKEVGNRFSLALITWIALHLGRPIARLMLVFITAYFYITCSSARKASRDYLSLALGKSPNRLQLYRHFYFFSSVTLDRLFFLSGRTHYFDIKTEGKDVANNLRQSTKGCLLFVSHIGSFDVMRIMGTRDDALPIRILMDHQHNSMAMQLIDRLDPELASKIINVKQSKTELILQMQEYIEQGEMIGIMVDRLKKDEAGVKCRIFGKTVTMPTGPWLLASILKVPIIICFSLFHGKNRYSIHFELFSRQIDCNRGNRSEIIGEHIQSYCQRIEHYLSLQPYNWFNFYEFWDVDAPNR